MNLEIINKTLHSYENSILNVIDLFIKKYGVKNPLKLWRNGKIERVGFLDLDNLIEYSFHGAGCTINSNGVIISFDFDEKDNYKFDLFKFKIFINSNPNYNSYKEDLLKLIDEDKIVVDKNNPFSIKYLND